MTNTPVRSVGIIMDGNRRWAKARGLPTLAGHTAGVETIKRLAKNIQSLEKEYGLEYITLYTFSTENWNRSPEEIEHLMKLLETEFNALANELGAQNIRVRIIGDRTAFSESLQKIFNEIEEKTKDNTSVTVVFALSYGGRAELVRALQMVVKEGVPVSEESLSSHLYTAGMPDPDIIIRTGGEKRLSGFLTWQSVYSELFFVDEYWPDFSIQTLKGILDDFKHRERRHGK